MPDIATPVLSGRGSRQSRESRRATAITSSGKSDLANAEARPRSVGWERFSGGGVDGGGGGGGGRGTASGVELGFLERSGVDRGSFRARSEGRLFSEPGVTRPATSCSDVNKRTLEEPFCPRLDIRQRSPAHPLDIHSCFSIQGTFARKNGPPTVRLTVALLS